MFSFLFLSVLFSLHYLPALRCVFVFFPVSPSSFCIAALFLCLILHLCFSLLRPNFIFSLPPPTPLPPSPFNSLFQCLSLIFTLSHFLTHIFSLSYFLTLTLSRPHPLCLPTPSFLLFCFLPFPSLSLFPPPSPSSLPSRMQNPNTAPG